MYWLSTEWFFPYTYIPIRYDLNFYKHTHTIITNVCGWTGNRNCTFSCGLRIAKFYEISVKPCQVLKGVVFEQCVVHVLNYSLLVWQNVPKSFKHCQFNCSLIHLSNYSKCYYLGLRCHYTDFTDFYLQLMLLRRYFCKFSCILVICQILSL